MTTKAPAQKLCQSCQRRPSIKSITDNMGRKRRYCEACHSSRMASIKKIKQGAKNAINA